MIALLVKGLPGKHGSTPRTHVLKTGHGGELIILALGRLRQMGPGVSLASQSSLRSEIMFYLFFNWKVHKE